MGILKKIKAYLRGYPRAEPRRSVIPVGTGSRIYVDAGGDLTFATCVNILANYIAQCRWTIYDADNNAVPGTAPGFRRCLNIEPYPGINAYDFWEFMERQRLVSGNAYALISYNKDTSLAYLVPLDSAGMEIYWDDANILEGKRRFVYWYRDARTGQSYTMLPEEVLHFKAFSSNGIKGRRAIDVLGQALAANAEVESALRTAVQNGFAGTIVLSYTSDLSMSKQKELQKQVRELLASSEHTVLPLPVGMSATNIANDIKGYYETIKEAKVEDISALFGIPLAMLNKMGGTGSATFSAAQMTSFYGLTVQPIITRYACEMTNKLLTYRQQSRGYYVATENDAFDILDAQSKASVLCGYVGAGVMTSNEARRSLKYQQSKDAGADILTQRGGTGALGDSPAQEQGNKGGEGT